MSDTPDPRLDAAPRRADAAFLLQHPAHLIALGGGSGLSPKAPGTAGTLWAWATFALLQPWLTERQWGWLVAAAVPIGWWACSMTARALRQQDPGCVVWDEIGAFWLVLWLISPTSFTAQLAAFALFRFFDAVKPGPVGWADRLFHRVDPCSDRAAWTKAGLGIMLDDYVAAFCTVLVVALWRSW